MYSFSLSKQQWTIFSNLKCSRNIHGSVVIGNSVFLIGGDDNKTIEEYNISTKTFKKIATVKNVRREFGICAINKNEVLIAGGYENNETTNNSFLFNINSKTFKDVGNLKTKKYGHVLVNVEGVVYAIGGWNRNEYLNTIEILDPVTNNGKYQM